MPRSRKRSPCWSRWRWSAPAGPFIGTRCGRCARGPPRGHHVPHFCWGPVRRLRDGARPAAGAGEEVGGDAAEISPARHLPPLFTSAAGAGGVPAPGRGDNHLSALDDLTGPGRAVRGVVRRHHVGVTHHPGALAHVGRRLQRRRRVADHGAGAGGRARRPGGAPLGGRLSGARRRSGPDAGAAARLRGARRGGRGGAAEAVVAARRRW
mmetsp:Transcript_16304/g.46209  ORF Transcript_16304/g.46209 Transcript_16304/m.46209 type:complete len:209 (-) Transcript_16304:16-642(-)